MSEPNSMGYPAQLSGSSAGDGRHIDLLQAIDFVLLLAQTNLANAQERFPIAGSGVGDALAQIEAARQHLIDYVETLPPF